MKKITTIILFLVFYTITMSSCKQVNEKQEYTIKGTLLQSCENSLPVGGIRLILDYDCDCNASKILAESFTDVNGKFEFKYSTVPGNDIIISGIQPNGGGTKNYLFGIPINKDLDIGNLYSNDNFFAIVKLNVLRSTNSFDTLFYDLFGSGNYRKTIIGPFTNGLALDTLVFRNTQFYDVNNERIYISNSSASYSYKVGANGNTNFAGGMFQTCLKYNYFTIEIK